MNLYEPRSGNLMLCECGHLKAYHGDHAMWHGGPLHYGCAMCYKAPGQPLGCQEFKAGAYQGYSMKPDPHGQD
jgi:hypothetical protein